MKDSLLRSRTLFTTAMLLLSLFFFPSILLAGSPTEQIRATIDRAVAILKDPQFKTSLGWEEARSHLRRVIYDRFDFNEMARRTLGHRWRQLSLSEKEEFTGLFTALLERTYLDKLQSFDEDEITFLRERREDNYAEVVSRIRTRDGSKIFIKYRAYLVNGEWKIYDIVAENISLVNNYRSQFKRILAKSSYEELVKRIRQKL